MKNITAFLFKSFRALSFPSAYPSTLFCLLKISVPFSLFPFTFFSLYLPLPALLPFPLLSFTLWMRGRSVCPSLHRATIQQCMLQPFLHASKESKCLCLIVHHRTRMGKAFFLVGLFFFFSPGPSDLNSPLCSFSTAFSVVFSSKIIQSRYLSWQSPAAMDPTGSSSQGEGELPFFQINCLLI